MVNPTEEKVHKTQLLRTVINTCLLTNDKNVHAIINYSRMGIRDRALLYCSLYIREVGPQIKLQRTLKSCFQTCFISAARQQQCISTELLYINSPVKSPLHKPAHRLRGFSCIYLGFISIF